MSINQTKEVVRTLREDVMPHLPDGTKRLKSLNVAVNDAAWLSPLRNGMGFHFPTFELCSSHFVPDESWVDDIVFLGDKSGNTYCDASDSVAQAWMFQQYGAKSPETAVDPLINKMIDLLKIMNSFVEDALVTFIVMVILDGPAKTQPAGKVLAPEFESVSIPFWTVMPSKSS